MKLNQLFAQVSAKLSPIFTRLQSLAGMEIGSNFATISDVEVDVTAIGLRNATAFVGIPPSGGFNWTDTNGDGVLDVPLVDQDAIGLVIENLDLGVGVFKPVVSKQLPTFTAAKITADSAGFIWGDTDVLELVARKIQVQLNLGGPIIQGAGALVGTATIDFPVSFPTNGGYQVQTGTTTAPVLLDFHTGELIRASVANATLKISNFVHVTGSMAFEKGPVHTVSVTGGLLSGVTGAALDAILNPLGITLPAGVSIPATGATSTELSFMTIGASNVHAFVGLDGPYWTDLDLNNQVGWAFNTGTGSNATRTISSGSVTLNINGTPTTFSAGTSNNVLPAGIVVTLSSSGTPLMVNGATYGDANNNQKVDVGETGELSGDAKGLVIDDFDFGMAIMKPTSPIDFAKYFALRATANAIKLVGIQNVTVDAHDLLVEVNQSSPSVYGVPLFPVVDFARTPDYASEELTLFDTNHNGVITMGELATLNSTHSAGIAALAGVSLNDSKAVDHEKLLAILNTNNTGDSQGVIDLTEAAALLGGDSSANTAAQNADRDGDKKIDPVGFEVNTGGAPVYLNMNSSLIRAQGFVNLNLLNVVYVSGSVAFELGPTEQVTLDDTAHTQKTVTTMSIGAANVTAFIGVNGPYWRDTNDDHTVQSSELNSQSKGFHITDFDIGILLMASTNPQDVGLYLAAKLSVHSFGLVGLPGFTASGAFDVALNVGFGLSGMEPSIAVVDFPASFSEAPALFALLDGNHDHVIDQNEQTGALAAGGIGEDITSVAQLVSVLNTSGGVAPDAYLTMSEVLAKLKDSFETSHQTAINALDTDGNGRLNTGFEVNTGDPTSPVVLDFDQFLISIQLGGRIELQNVFRLYGIFLFQVDPTGLKAFVAAGLEVGPDIGATQGNKLFTMNALGALIITGDGIAADIDVSASVGGALSSVLRFNASARMVLNTTGLRQQITIPKRYVDFLTGTTSLSELPASGLNDPSQLSSLIKPLGSRFTVNSDGSATFSISPGGPQL